MSAKIFYYQKGMLSTYVNVKYHFAAEYCNFKKSVFRVYYGQIRKVLL